MKRKYYPNNWQAIKECPSHYFPPMEYEEFAAWKIHGYQLPSSHYGIVRIENKDAGTVEEYTYKTEHHTKMRPEHLLLPQSPASTFEITPLLLFAAIANLSIQTTIYFFYFQMHNN